jgi:ABC-type glutathione transport system ATPase component
MNDTASTSMLRARGLRKEYGKDAGLVRAVDEVDLDVAQAETVAIMGPSGCGKSTLLHLLGGLDSPSARILTIPPLSWLIAAVLGTLLVVAGLTAIPARIGARRPVAEILQSETA